jgi:hypothetical protein
VSLTEPQIMAALRERYAAPEYAFLAQVRSRTGYRGAIRTADALAMSLFPSRGLELYGIEVKVSRNDWLREKKDPAKAEEIARYCDRWLLVVGDEAIVKPGELPATWGLLAPKGNKLVLHTAPSKLEPKPISPDFLAAVFRNLHEEQKSFVHRSEIAAEIDKARQDGIAVGEGHRRAEERIVQRDLDQIRESVRAFEAASGVKLDRWSGGRIGEAVKLVLEGNVERRRHELTAMAKRTRAMADELDALLAGKDETEEPPPAPAPPAPTPARSLWAAVTRRAPAPRPPHP